MRSLFIVRRGVYTYEIMVSWKDERSLVYLNFFGWIHSGVDSIFKILNLEVMKWRNLRFEKAENVIMMPMMGSLKMAKENKSWTLRNSTNNPTSPLFLLQRTKWKKRKISISSSIFYSIYWVQYSIYRSSTDIHIG